MNDRWTALIAGIVVGGLGGAILAALGLASLTSGVLLGAIYGLLFALLGAPRASSPGGGLLWGIAYALLLWLAGPAGLFPLVSEALAAPSVSTIHSMGMLDTARAHFPELV